ncbi:transposase [Paraburkholderia tropica]
MGMLREQGATIGRFNVSRLMGELGLICKQPGNHAYKRATVERVDIPNVLNREFDVVAPNQVWCGDITYLWAQGRWHYLAVVLDLFTRRVVGWSFSTGPDADLVVKALDMAFEQRDRPTGLMFHSDQGGQYALNHGLRHVLLKWMGAPKELAQEEYHRAEERTVQRAAKARKQPPADAV